MSANGRAEAWPPTASWKAFSSSSSGVGEHDRSAVDLGVEARLAGEVGQPVHRQVHLHHAAAAAPPLDVVDEVGREGRAVHQLEEGDRGVRRGDDDGRGELLAGRQHHAGRDAARGADLGHAGRGADLGAERPGRRGHGLGDPTHAAAREAPGAGPAVAQVTDVVVSHHVGRAGRPRPGPGADDAAHGQQALDLVGGEELVEQVGDAHREAGGWPRPTAAYVESLAGGAAASAERAGRRAGGTPAAAGCLRAADPARARGRPSRSPTRRWRQRPCRRTSRSARGGGPGRRAAAGSARPA